MKIVPSLASLLFLGLPALVQGATVSYTAVASLSGGNGTSSTTVSLQQFDPALGTLTGVTFTLADTTVITLAYENATNPAGSYGSSETVTTDLDDGATTLATSSTSATWSSSLSTFDGAVDFSGTSGATLSGTFSGTGTGSGSLTAYLGTGSSTFTLNRVAIQTGVNMPFVINNAAASSYTATVTYSYTPIPEPALAGLFGIALGATGLRRRRRTS